ncbi:hypothetical protein QE152_g14419 [Popillia japonica]|uniref:Uncharacterized protein n=1 Tax=Popillia japonica TaxID=7064 RepID=A0AAW1L6N4_POPJA
MMVKAVPSILTNIRTAKTDIIKAFHTLVYESPGDRGNRQRLRYFSGFTFATNSDEYNVKCQYVKNNLLLGNLISIRNILSIDYQDNEDDIINRICEHLINLDKLNTIPTYDDEKDKNEDNDADEDNRINAVMMMKRTKMKIMMQMKIIESMP